MAQGGPDKDTEMKTAIFITSLGLSTWLVGTIQEHHFNLGFMVGSVLLALHFLIALFFVSHKGVNQ
jgi:hypothetical protein